MDCSPPGSPVHGILQARVLEWVAMSSSIPSSKPRDRPRSPALQVDSLPSEPPGNHPPAPATLAKSNKNRSALKFKGRKQKKRKVSRCLMPGVKSLQSCPSPCDPMNSPGSSVRGIFQARILEWIAISFSRSVNRKGREITREAQGSYFSPASWSLQWRVGGGCQEGGDCSFLSSACQGGTCWSASLP